MQRLRDTRGTEQRAAEFGLQSGLVAGLIDKVHHRQAEQTAQIDVTLHLVRRLHRHGTALHFRIIGNHAHRHAVQARQRRDHRASLVATDLEDRTCIHHTGEDLARVVDLAPLMRNGVFQPVVGPVRIVTGAQHRRRVKSTARQVAQEALHLRQRIDFIHRLVVHQRALALHQVTTELVLVDGLPIGLQHDVRPGGHYLRLLAYHDGEVRGQHLDRSLPGAGAQRDTDYRHSFQQLVGRPAWVLGNLGAADLHQELDAAAGRINQAYQRHAQLVRHAFDVNPLVGNRRFRGAGADREVVHMQRHFAAINASRAHDGIGRVESLKHAITAVMALPGQATEFAKGVGVEQLRNALAGVQAPTGLEFGKRFGSAHGTRLRAAQLQFGEFLCPLTRGFKVQRRVHWASSLSSATSAWVDLSSACR